MKVTIKNKGHNRMAVYRTFEKFCKKSREEALGLFKASKPSLSFTAKKEANAFLLAVTSQGATAEVE